MSTQSGACGAERASVLVVDDVATQRSYLKEILLESGYGVQEAADGIEALAHARRTRPEVVITDLEMPRMNGLALVRALRIDPHAGHVGIIMLTSRDDQDSRFAGLDAGVDEYIAKPGHPREVRARVRSLVRLQRALRDLEQRNHELTTAIEEVQRSHRRTVAAEKLAYAASLAQGLAHEMNNPLSSVQANLGVLEEYVSRIAAALPPAARSDTTLEAILADVPSLFGDATGACTRLGEAIRQLGALQAPSDEDQELGPVDLAEAVAQALAQVGPLPEGLSLVTEMAGPSLFVETSRDELVNDLARLLAYLARHGRGAITLRASPSPGRVRLLIEADSSDLGEDSVRELFSPGLSPRDGTMHFDLRLSAVRESLLRMGALVEAEPVAGAGVRVLVHLAEATSPPSRHAAA